MKTAISSKEYLDFIGRAIASDGWRVADTANKLALESGAISQAQYSAAAQLIVKAFLAN